MINTGRGGGTQAHAQSRHGSLRNNVIRSSVRVAVALYARDDAASADLFSAIVTTRTHGTAAGSERDAHASRRQEETTARAAAAATRTHT